MKSYLIIILAAFAFIFSGCEDEKDTRALYKKYLTVGGDWLLTSATVDGVEVDTYAGLAVAFKPKEYTSVNGKAIWPASGTWNLDKKDDRKIIRDGSLEMTIKEISSRKLVLEFNWESDTWGGGRSESTSGEHVMVFERLQL